MLRWKRWNFKDLIARHEGNIQRRFILRVLAPPFVILLILGTLGLWQLDKFVRRQAVSDLNRSATTTAAKLEREFGIRQTVLKRTGDDLFKIKSDYLSDNQLLEKQRAECSAHVKKTKSFQSAPNNSCEPFLIDFASKGATQQAVEDGYVREGEENIKDLNQSINDRLSAYKQFFPETLALVVVDDKGQVVSSALSDVFKGSAQSLLSDTNTAQKQAVEGKVSSVENFRIGVFAYPINGGSVLAAYNLDSDSFMKETWESTPIDKSKALAVFLGPDGQVVYPKLNISNNFKDVNNNLRMKPYADMNLKNVKHIAVGAEAGKSKWLAVVASPKAVVFGPVRDAQLAAVFVIGFLLIGFLWVGAFFIQRTVRSILRLVSGALVFSAGKLDYKIQLDHSDKEFTALAETMNTMAERIAGAEKEIDEKNKEFISIATHELRTPLTAILGNLSMAVEDFGDRLDETTKPIVERAYKGTTRLRDLVNDMLDMARLEGGRVEFVIAPQDIKSTVQDVVENLQITAQDANITLHYEDSGAQPVLADASKLRIVLNNFVSNAIKYNRQGGSVTVAHSIDGDQLITAITDTGLGIPEDQKAHMFEKFFRVADADRENVAGTGLGMYITREYVLKMGGKLWFDSTHGQGTTFYFSLPLSPEQVAVNKPEPASPELLSAATPDGPATP